MKYCCCWRFLRNSSVLGENIGGSKMEVVKDGTWKSVLLNYIRRLPVLEVSVLLFFLCWLEKAATTSRHELVNSCGTCLWFSESQCGPSRFESGSCLLELGGVVWLKSSVNEVEDVRKGWGAVVLHLICSEVEGNDVNRGHGTRMVLLARGSPHWISALLCFDTSAWQFKGLLDLADDLLWSRASVENPLFFFFRISWSSLLIQSWLSGNMERWFWLS